MFGGGGDYDFDSSANTQQASAFTSDNANTIGSPIPVVLGRAMVKNPLVSFYGDFRADPYTEEYGLHTGLDATALLWPILLGILFSLIAPAKHPTSNGGEAVDTKNGSKFDSLVEALIKLLIALLFYLFMNHDGRVTMQKGFKYYLGWQHIICWTGENFGIKKLWMNVYDSELEASTEQGVWGSDNISWKSDNPTGIVVHIDDEDMFGGVDVGGGFIGDIRLYFGTRSQGRDAWMSHQMTLSPEIPSSLKGLTPVYPMFFTCVVPTAYIGRQATIPEMWFEVVNYPNGLYKQYKYDLQGLYTDKLTKYLDDIYSYLAKQDRAVQAYIQPYKNALDSAKAAYEADATTSNALLKTLDEARDTLENAKLSGDSTAISIAQTQFNQAKARYEAANAVTVASFNAVKNATSNLLNNYPPSKRDEFKTYADRLINLYNKGLWHLGRLGDDLNPAEAIYEIITNSYWGCNYYNISEIDVKSLMELGITCEEEGLGVSCLINNVSTAGDYIDKILDHINGVKFDNPFTGKLSFKLLRKDYNLSDLVEFNVSNCSTCNFSRVDWSQVASSVSIDFTFADEKYDKSQTMVYDLANKFISKTNITKNVNGEYFTTINNAIKMAKYKLLSFGYPLSAVELRSNRLGQFITVGDPILVNWEPYGIIKQVYRVTNVDYASLTSNTITIEAVEDVFGFEDADYTYADIPVWTDPERTPQDVVYYKFIEYPYELVYSLDTYIRAITAKPSNSVDYYCTWRDVNGTYNKTNRSMKWGMVANTAVGLSETYGDTPDTLEISVIGTDTRQLFEDKMSLIGAKPSTYTNKSSLNVMLVDNEFISYSDITTLPNGNLLVSGLVRGIYDTLPKTHTAYTKVYFLDYVLDVNGGSPVALEGQVSSEVLEITTETTREAQDFDIDKATHYNTKRRTEAPSPMANLQFGANRGTVTEFTYNKPAGTTYSEDIVTKFNVRNKFDGSSGIHKQTDTIATVKMSDDIQYYVKASSNNVEFTEFFDSRKSATSPITGGPIKVDITSFTYKWATFCRRMSTRLMERNEVTLEIGSYNKDKNLYSYDHYEKTIFYSTPRIAGVIMDSPTLLADVQAYANSIIQTTTVEIPASRYIQNTTMTFDDCPLIMVATGINSSSDIIMQNGTRVDLGNKAYRVDGYDSTTGQAIIHEVTIDEEYVVRTNFNATVKDQKTFWKYRSGTWIPFNVYTTI